MGNNNQIIDGLIPHKRTKEPSCDSTNSIEQDLGILEEVVGCPKLVKSNKTGILLEKYQVVSSPENSIAQDIQIYKLRSSSYSKNLAVVFDHSLLDHRGKKFMVKIQNFVGRLNQVTNLTSAEALVIFHNVLNGFNQIVYHCKMHFYVSNHMIALNQAGQVRVWANENFALNAISPKAKLGNQNQMIHSIEQTILKHVSQEYHKQFLTCSYQLRKFQKLSEAKTKLDSMISHLNKKAILLELMEKFKDKDNGHHRREDLKGINIHQEKINISSQQFRKTDELNIMTPVYQRAMKIDKQENLSHFGQEKEHDKTREQKVNDKTRQQKVQNKGHHIFRKLKERSLTPEKNTKIPELKTYISPNRKIMHRQKSPIRIIYPQKSEKTPFSYSDIVVTSSNPDYSQELHKKKQIKIKTIMPLPEKQNFLTNQDAIKKQPPKDSIEADILHQNKGPKVVISGKLVSKFKSQSPISHGIFNQRDIHNNNPNHQRRDQSPIKAPDRSPNNHQPKIIFNNNINFPKMEKQSLLPANRYSHL